MKARETQPEILIQEISRIAEVNHLYLSGPGLPTYIIAMGFLKLAKGVDKILARHGIMTGHDTFP